LARSSEPIFNVPAVVLSIIVVLVLIQASREWLLTDDENFGFLLCFAFIPARYDTSLLGTESFPGGVGAYKGPPASIDVTKVRQLKAKGMGASEIAKALKIGRASVYRVLGERA
jgi:Helix-turn-helix domain of resolvase